MADYSKMTPPEVWKLIRTGEITRPTAGMCAGYAQANLVILPKKYADDFKEFARKNPKPCPILEVVEGTPDIHDMGEGASIVTDIPKYFIYRDGVKVDEVTDVSSYPSPKLFTLFLNAEILAVTSKLQSFQLLR